MYVNFGNVLFTRLMTAAVAQVIDINLKVLISK